VSARFARGTTARARFTRRLPSNGRSRVLPPINHSSHPSHCRARRRPTRVTHTSYSSLDPLLIHTHTHHSLRRHVRPTTCPTDQTLDVTTTRPLARHFTSPAADARRRRPPRTPHAHARTHLPRTPTKRTSHHPTSIRPVHAPDRTRGSERRNTHTHTRGHRARTARPPPSSSVRTNVEHSF